MPVCMSMGVSTHLVAYIIPVLHVTMRGINTPMVTYM
jgi:hypothetical protein